jgi:biotin-dependent carboxylase-like uncharacterized protein
MNAFLEIVNPGALASLQDLGRPGFRRLGVPRAGALQPDWLRLANALLGNPEGAPAIEFFVGGLAVRALDSPVQLALAGNFSAAVVGAGGCCRLESWRSVTLAPGETLRCGLLSSGRVGYLALAGVSVHKQLGSASTYAPAGLGGLDGRCLSPGVRLPVGECRAGQQMLRTLPPLNAAPIRVVPGPQEDYFTAASLACFLSEPYQVSAATDRMGMRLHGPVLRHRPEKGSEMTSDATVPGSIQVPGSGTADRAARRRPDRGRISEDRDGDLGRSAAPGGTGTGTAHSLCHRFGGGCRTGGARARGKLCTR